MNNIQIPWNKGNRKYISNCLYCNKEIKSFSKKKYCDKNCYYKSDAFKELHHLNGIKTTKDIKGVGKGKLRISRDYKYVFLQNHPDSLKQGYIAEHRLVAESKIGRRLLKNEVVHHIDENRGNNDVDNLIVLDRKDHSALHFYYDLLKGKRKRNVDKTL